MIELPEALVIARQMDEALAGKRIKRGNRGNTPHKFAFANGSSEEYEAILQGKTVGRSSAHGNAILTAIEPGYALVLGGGGERILFHPQSHKLPEKHHLWLGFEDGTALTVSVQGWGNTLLLPRSVANDHRHVQASKVTPLSEAFTWEHCRSLFAQVDPESKASVKYAVISDPGIWGIGNGCLQDILFRAGLHPRRRVVDTTAEERQALYASIQDTLQQIVNQGGRDSERDLYNRPGGYRRLLHSKTVGQPCPACGTPIEKIQYLGGACYFCSQCQV
jgi:formamidopyrimidine-DNA glycosylase